MLLAKRVIAYSIDYIVISIPIMILSMAIGLLPIFNTNGDYPFLIISFVFMPHVFWKNVFLYPNYYGNLLWVPCVVLASIIFESIIYSLQIRLFGTTPGNKMLHLQIISNKDESIEFSRIFIWSILKVSCKYLFPITLASYLFSSDKVTFYDSIMGVFVQEKTKKDY